MSAPIPRKGDAALALKIAGATWSEIMSALNFSSEQAVRNAVQTAAAANMTDEDRSQHRQMALMRYERLLRSGMVKAMDANNGEHLSAIRACTELVNRIVALTGAAMPTELVIHTPTESQLREWVQQVSQIKMPEVQEYDIFDADVVPEIESGETQAG